MKTILSKTKFVAGIAFIVQAITCAVLSLAFFNKKKSTAKILLLASVIGGAIGGLLLAWHASSEEKYNKFEEIFDSTRDDNFDEIFSSIPEDDTACEEDFED